MSFPVMAFSHNPAKTTGAAYSLWLELTSPVLLQYCRVCRIMMVASAQKGTLYGAWCGGLLLYARRFFVTKTCPEDSEEIDGH